MAAVWAEEKADNLERAISCYQEALKVRRPQNLPNNCRLTARLLGNLYAGENRWQEAVSAYQTALEAVEVLYDDSLTLKGKQDELAATGTLYYFYLCAECRCFEQSPRYCPSRFS